MRTENYERVTTARTEVISKKIVKCRIALEYQVPKLNNYDKEVYEKGNEMNTSQSIHLHQ